VSIYQAAADGSTLRDLGGAAAILRHPDGTITHRTQHLARPEFDPERGTPTSETVAVTLALDLLDDLGITDCQVYVDNHLSETLIRAAGHTPVRVRSDDAPPLHAAAHLLAYYARQQVPTTSPHVQTQVRTVLDAGTEAKTAAEQFVYSHLFPTGGRKP
jgi:hypothetical protein